MYTYPIDYDQFTTDEIIAIVEFLALVEEANTTKIDPHVLSAKHEQFRRIVNSISLEKQIDRAFEKVSGFSIFKTIKKYK
ncbi:UPF0223 family protein [Candidatus Xianfuyuplasma coldseepsis]|uniref:Uncharacterized protein n=1 Tax=Candidatus Xianfuyuplasma coldseepsis TaxID=2782163 RepID=A0A7L7KSZ1_9MOLU|nr:UPF0223 family protein [Xianfuyuplasma coldseepsis]QMS85519.1 hypothetical protein G4Z02_07110 [Xianfuyuplasma coldseepsis]